MFFDADAMFLGNIAWTRTASVPRRKFKKNYNMSDPITGANNGSKQTFLQGLGNSAKSSLTSALGGMPGGLISSGLDFLSNALFAKRNYRLAEKQAQNDFKRQVQLMNLQNQQNVENWKMQNEYNDPSAVIARLQGAGLNPALYYGGSASAATAGQIQGGSPGHGSSTVGAGAMPLNGIIGDNIERMARVANIEAQTENIKANTDKTKEETISEQIYQGVLESNKALIDSQKIGQDLKNNLLEWDEMERSATYNYNVGSMQEKFNLLVEQVANEKKRGDLLDSEKSNLDMSILGAFQTLCMNTLVFDLQKKYAEKFQEAELAKIWADVFEKNTNRTYTEAELYKLAEQNKFFADNPSYIGDMLDLAKEVQEKSIAISNRDSWFNNINNSLGTLIDGVNAYSNLYMPDIMIERSETTTRHKGGSTKTVSESRPGGWRIPMK